MVQQPRLRFSGTENPESHDVMRQLLLVIVVHCLLTPVLSVNGVIWDKKMSDFVPIVSNPIFAAMNQELLSRSRQEEIHNFQGRTFKISYYEIDYVISSAENGTRITGYIGDTWNILAEYLNFTLKPDCTSLRASGIEINGTYTPGLLKTIYLNRTDIIARVEALPSKLNAAQLTLPFRISRHSGLTKLKRYHITTWMVKLYSRKVWFAILATYIILSVCSYVFHVIETDIFRGNVIPGMVDTFFYNLSTICFQNCNTSTTRCTRMIECLIGLFALLINTTYNAVIFGYMTQMIVSEMPFHDILSLLENTEYTIVALNGTLLYDLFAAKRIPDHSSRSRKKRVFFMNNITEVYMKLCTKELLATFLSDEINKRGKYPCKLQTLEDPLLVGISSGISWQFKNKRSIDVGLMRLYESGVLNAIHQHYSLKTWKEDNNLRLPEAIILEQVHFIYMVLFGGLVLSLIILILEQITFHCNK